MVEDTVPEEKRWVKCGETKLFWTLSWCFANYTNYLTKNKKWAIIIPVVISTIFFPGAIFGFVSELPMFNFVRERNYVWYLIPQDGGAFKAAAQANEQYEQGFPRGFDIIVESGEESDLKQTMLDSLIVHNTFVNYESEFEGRIDSWETLCYQPCEDGSLSGYLTPFSAFNYDAEVMSELTNEEIIDTLHQYYTEEQLEMMFPDHENLESTQKLWLNYNIRNVHDGEFEYIFEKNVDAELNALNALDIKVSTQSMYTRDASCIDLAFWAGITAVCTVIFLVLFLLFGVTSAYSKEHWIRVDWKLLGIMLGNIILVFMSSSGLYGYIYSAIDISFYLGFGVASGVVVDDMLVILSHYRHDANGTPEERIIRTLIICSQSITFTTLTSIMAFASSALIPIEFVRYTSITIVITLAFSYLYTVSFFCALVVGQAEERCDKVDQGRMTVVKTGDDGQVEAVVRKSRYTLNGTKMKILPKDIEVVENQDDINDEDEIAAKCNDELNAEEIYKGEDFGLEELTTNEVDLHVATVQQVQFLKNCLKSRFTCFFLLLVMIGLAILGFYAGINGEEEAGIFPMLHKNSEWVTYNRRAYEFGDHPGLQLVINNIFSNIDYTDPEVQEKLSGLTEEVQAQGVWYNTTEFWWDAYEQYDERNYSDSNIIYFMSEVEPKYEHMYAANDAKDQLISTIGTFRAKRHLVEGWLLHEVLYRLDDFDDYLGPKINSKWYQFPHSAQAEIDRLVKKILVNVVGSAMISVLIGSIIFLNWKQSIILLLSIILIDINVIGLTWLFQIAIGPVSLLCIMAGFGFAVDYNIHTLHGWYHSGKHYRDYDGKLEFLLDVIAPASFNAAMTTIVVFTAFYLTGYILMRNLATGFITIILLSILYSCIIIPCMLHNIYSFILPVDGKYLSDNKIQSEI